MSPDTPSPGDRIANAVAFWERGRLGFNGVLALLVFAVAAATNSWRLIGQNVAMFFALGVVANILYCAIYPVDQFVQGTQLGALWRKYRWVVWVAGTLFAVMCASVVVLGVGFIFTH